MKISEFIVNQRNQEINKIVNVYDNFITILMTPEYWHDIVIHADKMDILIDYYDKERIKIKIPNAKIPLFKRTKILKSCEIIEDFFNLRKKYLSYCLEKQLPKPIENSIKYSSENILLDEPFWYLPSQNDTVEKMKVKIKDIGYTLIKISTNQPIKDIDKFFDDLKNKLNEEKRKINNFIYDIKDTKIVMPSSSC